MSGKMHNRQLELRGGLFSEVCQATSIEAIGVI